MAVIFELSVAPSAFEIGQILDVPAAGSLTMETLVPLGDEAIPFVRLHDDGGDAFERTLRADDRVRNVELVSENGEQRLYALDWDVSEDAFFEAIRGSEGHVLDATGTAERWQFQLWFPDHDRLSAFDARLDDVNIPFEVSGIYNPTKPDAGPWFGLTKPQRDTLVRAVEAGYYSIPRRISTNELAEEFDISDQAVTERLRRAVATLATNALLVAEEE